MSGATNTDYELYSGAKEMYGSESYYQTNIRSSLYNFIDKASGDEVNFDGKQFNVAVKLALNESYGAINSGERLPDPETLLEVFATYKAKLMYANIEAETYAAVRGGKGGRVDGKYLDDIVKGTALTMTSNIDYDCYANGRGFRADVATATPAASSFTVVTSGILRARQKLDWYDSTLATKRGSIKIADKGLDYMNRTVYIDSTFGSGAVPTGAVAGDKLVVINALAPGEPADGRYAMGLARMTDNTLSIGGLSPSTYAQWMSINQNANGGNPSQQLMQIQWDSMDTISGVTPNRCAFNPAYKRGYLNQFLNQRRFASNAYDTGASSLSFSPVKMGEDEKGKKIPPFKMLEDKNCDPSVFYTWNNEAFKFAAEYTQAPAIADEDGKEFRFKWGYDAMAGFYRYWGNNVVFMRNAIGKIYGNATGTAVI